MISGNVPKHLVVAARTGFLTGVKAKAFDWQKIAMTLNMGAKSIDLVDLGGAPMPVNSKTGITVQDFIEKTKEVTPLEWNITVWISQNAIDDDQTGMLETKVKQAGQNFQKGINKRVFEVLNGGDSTTYGLAYDGQEFFDNDHVDGGGHYQTAQDNENTSALSLDNFETIWNASQLYVDDQGVYTEYDYDTLVVHPSNFRIANEIFGNPKDYGDANDTTNPYFGLIRNIVKSPYLDTAAWYLTAASEAVKPLILAMREQPHLQHAWFDPDANDGGRHYFKFYGRYEVHYGDWRLATQGQT